MKKSIGHLAKKTNRNDRQTGGRSMFWVMQQNQFKESCHCFSTKICEDDEEWDLLGNKTVVAGMCSGISQSLPKKKGNRMT